MGNQLVVRIAAIVAVLVVTVRAGSEKRPELDAGFPVRVEDAHPTDFRTAYFKFISRFEHADDGTDTTLVQPEVAWGFAPNFDLHLRNPYLIGDGDRSGSGDVVIDVQWLVLEEAPGRWWPAVAVEGTLQFPTGVGSEGIDTILQVDMTKTLTDKPAFDSVHLNLSWRHNSVPAADDRDDAFDGVLGYSRRVFDGLDVAADVFWEHTENDHEDTYVAEVGAIIEISEHLLIAGCVGMGLGDDSPDVTATLGFIVSN